MASCGAQGGTRFRWVDIKGAASAADVEEATVRAWCVSGRVHARKVAGSVWRVRLAEDGLPADPPEAPATNTALRTVDIHEAAARAAVHHATMRAWCSGGKVRARKVGGDLWRIFIDWDGLPADPIDSSACLPGKLDGSAASVPSCAQATTPDTGANSAIGAP